MGRHVEIKNLVKIQGTHWIWKGAKKAKGYGGYNFNGIQEYAHRVVYKLFYGEWPAITCHGCEYRKCVRPEHINSGTYTRNNRESAHKRRTISFESIMWVLHLRQKQFSYNQVVKETGINKGSVANICRVQERK